MSILRLHRPSLILALGLLVIEVLIAVFVRDGFVRPYLGDVLVVPLIFFTLNGFLLVRPVKLALAVLLFALAVEAAQALGLIHRLGLSDHTVARTVLGDTFQWGDMLCYAAGTIVCLVLAAPIERMRRT